MASRQSLSGSVKGTGLNNDATDHGGRERLPPFLFKYIVLLCRKTIVRRRTSIEKKPKTNEEVYSKPVKFVKEGDAPPAEATCFRKKKTGAMERASQRVVREGFGRRFGCQYFGELGSWKHDFAQQGQNISDRLRGLRVGCAKGDNRERYESGTGAVRG